MRVIARGRSALIREFSSDDIEPLQEAINHKEVAGTTCRIPHPYTLEHAEEFITRSMEQYDIAEAEELDYAIEKDGNLVGGIGIRDIKGGKAELGYWLTPKQWGKGITTAAVASFMDHLFKQVKLHQVEALVLPENIASIRVLEKNRFACSGTREHCCRLSDGQAVQVRLYVRDRLVKDEKQKRPIAR